MIPLRIGVVGLGFAGAAVATLLRRDGHDVTVYEATPKPSAVGAGIVLQPTGMAALADLGVLPAVIDRGSRLAELFCTTPSGATIFRLRYDELGEGCFGLGMHRGALFEILLEAADGARASLRTGIDVRGIEETTMAGIRRGILRPTLALPPLLRALEARSAARPNP